MKKELFSMVFASALLGAASMAYAGAYGEAEKPEEIPAPAPAPAPAPEPEAPKVMREFAGFLTDAETTRGLRAELGGEYAAEYHPSSVGDVEAAQGYAQITYGRELWEVGVLAPYQYAHQDNVSSQNDFGDMKLWGKILPLRTDMFTGGGGLIVTFPTGGGNLSTDEYGFEPFLTFGAKAGPADVRLSAGYEVTTSPNGFGVPSDAYDYSDMNLAALIPLGDHVVARGELTWNHLMGNDADPVSFFPGVDVSFPVGDFELQVRPTLGIGITQAPDWQVGLGLALLAPGI